MTLRRAVAWAGLAVAVATAPAVALVGIAAWQEFAPASLRQVVLAASALTEPKGVERMFGGIEAAVDGAVGEPPADRG